MKPALWHRHPGIRTGDELTFGERAADHLKRTFGSWGFLLSLIGGIVAWIAWNKLAPAGWRWDTSELLLLNLCLSIIAGLQGGALQIASNRGDRINSELALSTHATGEKLLELNLAQMQILQELRRIRDELRKDGT